MSEWENSGLTSHQQQGHTETGPRFKVSSEWPEKWGIDLAIPVLVVYRVIHYIIKIMIIKNIFKDIFKFQNFFFF